MQNFAKAICVVRCKMGWSYDACYNFTFVTHFAKLQTRAIPRSHCKNVIAKFDVGDEWNQGNILTSSGSFKSIHCHLPFIVQWGYTIQGWSFQV